MLMNPPTHLPNLEEYKYGGHSSTVGIVVLPTESNTNQSTMFAKIIFFFGLLVAAAYGKPVFPLAYSAPLVAAPSVAVASPLATPFATAAYTAAPFAAAYTASPYAYSAYPYSAYGSLLL
ncbi:uncharacterized protein LOC118510282 [Anopheles stephensi]|nr:uncharacterized protein LOC118510282 [Anopheles stephensi]